MPKNKIYWFWIKRDHSAKFEKIPVEAPDSHTAVENLPNCVYWDFTSAPIGQPFKIE